MIKKIILTILITIISCFSIFMVTGCDNEEVNDQQVFERICRHDISIAYGGDITQQFYRDLATDNMYVLLSSGSSLTPYYNDEGKIMKYQEFKKQHIDRYHK